MVRTLGVSDDTGVFCCSTNRIVGMSISEHMNDTKLDHRNGPLKANSGLERVVDLAANARTELVNDTPQRTTVSLTAAPVREDTPKDNCLMKENTISVDIQNSLFPLKILISKRRGKVKQLKTEDLDLEV